MIDFSRFSTNGASKDDAVGISIKCIIEKENLNAYATLITAGKKISCHSHSEGEEWYIILSGAGDIWTGDIINNEITNVRKDTFSGGCIFCIYPNTAHQLKASSDVEMIFLCPESHLSNDRSGFDDLCK